MVVWLTGLSGAGKTTIAEAMVSSTKRTHPSLVLLDGDVIRALFGQGLGYALADREVQIGRMQRLALFLSKQGIGVVVTALYGNSELLDWNRSNLPGYFEVYVDTPLAVVEARDTKGLYAKARLGNMKNVVGIDIHWHPPQRPDLIVDTVNSTPETVANKIILAVPWLSKLTQDGNT